MIWRVSELEFTQNFCAYHLHSIQELKAPDKEKDLVYYRWFLSFINNRGIVEFDRVFFTDKVWFHQSGYVNSQKTRIWTMEKSYVFHKNPLHSQKLGFWTVLCTKKSLHSLFSCSKAMNMIVICNKMMLHIAYLMKKINFYTDFLACISYLMVFGSHILLF